MRRTQHGFEVEEAHGFDEPTETVSIMFSNDNLAQKFATISSRAPDSNHRVNRRVPSTRDKEIFGTKRGQRDVRTRSKAGFEIATGEFVSGARFRAAELPSLEPGLWIFDSRPGEWEEE
jgi:hypothetical protein